MGPDGSYFKVFMEEAGSISVALELILNFMIKSKNWERQKKTMYLYLKKGIEII